MLPEYLAQYNNVPIVDDLDLPPTDLPDFTAWKAERPAPTWRHREPRFVHSMKWRDRDGIEHLHVIRADDMQDVIQEITEMKQLIRAARAGCPKTGATTTEHAE